MKVVINKCFGGFSLSPEALLELWKRGGPVEVMTIKEYFGDRPDDGMFGPTSALQAWRDYQAGIPQSRLFLTVFTPDEQHVLSVDRSDKEFRAHPALVAVVEEMGEAANGGCAFLAVVDIPDDVQWHVEEYDGSEHIAEDHRIWR